MSDPSPIWYQIVLSILSNIINSVEKNQEQQSVNGSCTKRLLGEYKEFGLTIYTWGYLAQISKWPWYQP
jgi:hypothetical protein